jgi:hypothetical protein
MSEEKVDAKKLLEESRKEREAVNKVFDELLVKLSEEGYSNRGYSSESSITMKGELFATFLNTLTYTKNTLENIDKTLEATIRSSELLQNNFAKMTIQLMEQHIKNIEDGNTSTMDELDAQDSEKKIKEVKKNKK